MNKRKITFIGGGSSKFIREVVVDIFTYPILEDSHIELMDVDSERLQRSEKIVQKIIEQRKLGATVSSTMDRRKAIAGSSYLIITLMIGGFKAYHSDVAIPLRYGVSQTVSDTTGPGGVFRTIRTSPEMRKIGSDLLELAPDAWVLNYANPMSMNILALTRSGVTKAIGLCHSIQHLHRQISEWLSLPQAEVHYTAGGINHINFYLTVTHRGESLYPRLLAEKDRIVQENPAEVVRFELLEYLGYFPAEGPDHQSEYYGWFRKNQAEVSRLSADAFIGYNNDLSNFTKRTAEIEAQLAGAQPIVNERSLEYGARIIQAIEGGDAQSFYGNVPNHGLIENLPYDGIVEVPCLADANGIFPARVGRIPTVLASVMTPHIALYDLAVSGTFEKDRRLIYQAIQTDPLTSALLTLPKIR